VNWNEVERDERYRRVFVVWRCRSCGKRAVTIGAASPGNCCCSGKEVRV